MINGNGTATRRSNLERLALYLKRRAKLNRFLLVIDTKKGVVVSAITIIVSHLVKQTRFEVEL